MCNEDDSELHIRSTNDNIALRYDSRSLIPAAMADYDVVPLQSSNRLLDAFIDKLVP